MEPYFERCINGPPFQFNEDKRYEFRRLVSFEKWPKSVSVFPVRLAQAGFYYTGKSDEVICFVCGLRKSGWKDGDVPLVVHKQLNPTCVFLSDACIENIPFLPGSEGEAILSRLKDQAIENPEGFTSSLRANGPTVKIESNNTEIGQAKESGNVLAQGNPDAVKNNVADSCLRTVSTAEPTSKTAVSAPNVPAPSFSRRPGALSGMAIHASSTAQAAAGQSANSTSKMKSAQPPATTASRTSASSSLSAKSSESKDIPPSFGENPLRYERNRLETFKEWPSTAQIRPPELAKCGFFFTGSADRCKCVFCKGILRNWEEGDRPHIEHRKHFPQCPLVLGLNVGNVPLPLEQLPGQRPQKVGQLSNMYDSMADMEALGINTDRPKQPQYAIETQRLSSYRNWPTYKHQTPKQLAEAGFFYAGFGDNVKCFFCNGGLRNWEPDDDPWVEHAKYFPQCPYVKQNKGDDYISSVKVEAISDVPILRQMTPAFPKVAQLLPGEPGPRLEQREVRARMDSPHVKAALAMGFSRDLVMKTLSKQLLDKGDDFPSAASLLAAVFAMEDDIARKQSLIPAAMEIIPVDDVTPPLETAVSDDVVPNDVDVTPAPIDDSVIGDMTRSSSDNDLKEESSVDLKKETSGKMKKSSSMPDADQSQLLQENLDMKEQRLCKICMVADASVVFLPCGHLVSCAACAPALSHCPICRADIKGTVRTYMS